MSSSLIVPHTGFFFPDPVNSREQQSVPGAEVLSLSLAWQMEFLRLAADYVAVPSHLGTSTKSIIIREATLQ